MYTIIEFMITDKLENIEVEKINLDNRKSPASSSSKEADEGYCRSPSLPRTILGSQGEEDDESVDNFAYLRKQAQTAELAKQTKQSQGNYSYISIIGNDQSIILREIPRTIDYMS